MLNIFCGHLNMYYCITNCIKLCVILISAQREGSLSEATSPETDQTDPFYAHCKLHVDKLVAKLVLF